MLRSCTPAFLSTLVLLFMASTSTAGVYLEPYGGFENGTYKGTMSITSPAPLTASSSAKLKGSAFGGKLGLSEMRVAMGLDYMHGSATSKQPGQSSVSGSEDDLGAFLALPLFFSLRMSGTYFFNSKLKSAGSEYSGDGFKAGLSLPLFFALHLNVEMVSMHHKQAKTPGTVYSTFDYKENSTLFSLSLPLGL